MQVWDERKLIFSSDAMDFGEDHYPITELETAAVYHPGSAAITSQFRRRHNPARQQ
jgi:hypothetical protein